MRALASIALVVAIGTNAGCGSVERVEAPAEPAAPSAFQLRVVTRDLTAPVHVVSTPSQPRRLFVVEQGGTIRIVQNGRVLPRLFLDLRGRVAGATEQGLLGLAFDPRYARNRLVYVNYTDAEGDTRIVRYRTNGERVLPGTRRELMRVEQPWPNHNGGNLVFGPGGYLYVGLGDGGPQGASQAMGSVLGKMLRLDVRRARPRPVIIGNGLRNPWRYSFDRATGDLYIADVGWRSREEVSFTPRARLGRLQNYGWEIWEGTLQLQQKARGPGALVMPIFEYDHDKGCSIVGGFVYRGSALPSERGRYVFGDYCSGTVWSLRVGNGRAQDVRVEPVEIPELTSFGESPAGEIFATGRNGVLYRLT